LVVLPAIRIPQFRVSPLARNSESFIRTFRTVTKRNTSYPELYMLQIIITLAAGVLGFVMARSFVRRRLRFVDAVHSPMAPIVAGSVAAVVAWPAVLLPLVTLPTALLFGIGTGFGTASGARALRNHEGDHRRLTP